MSPVNKIFATALILSAINLCPNIAQGKTKHGNKKHNVTLGFQTGRDALLNPSPNLQNKQTKFQYGANHGLTLRKKTGSHFKIESGFTYNQLQPQNFKNNFSCNNFNALKPYTLSLPATLQYYFLPEKSTLHPYCGAGIQTNINISPNTISPFTGDTYPGTNHQTYQTGTKYISILFTQGVTYEINTKIQITQSFHFIPNATKTFGIDLGIGYTLP